MPPARARVWLVLVLVLMTNVVSALGDPFFDGVSGQWYEPRIEEPADPRPAWRIPATVEMLSYSPVMLVMPLHVLPDVLPMPDLLPRPVFVPPRS